MLCKCKEIFVLDAGALYDDASVAVRVGQGGQERLDDAEGRHMRRDRVTSTTNCWNVLIGKTKNFLRNFALLKVILDD